MIIVVGLLLLLSLVGAYMAVLIERGSRRQGPRDPEAVDPAEQPWTQAELGPDALRPGALHASAATSENGEQP